MSRCIILGDMHWGVRNDSQFFLDNFSSFVKDVLVPACKEHDVKTIYQLGDMLDRRKFVNFLTLKTIRENFFGVLGAEGIEVKALVGNHDTFHKNTLEVNSIDLLFGDIRNFSPISEPIQIGNILVVPWLCEENQEEIHDVIRRSDADYVLGHFEFSGFDMYRGLPCEHGTDHKLFSRFKKIFSGHFHTRSSKDNVLYVGTPYEIIWSDYQDEKGFVVFDPDSGSETWIKNPGSVHLKVSYNEDLIDRRYDFSVVRSKFVKIIVEKALNRKKLDEFIKICYTNCPQHLTVIDVQTDDIAPEDVGEMIADKDPLTALVDEIRKKSLDDDTISSMVIKSNELYQDAMSDQDVSA